MITSNWICDDEKYQRDANIKEPINFTCCRGAFDQRGSNRMARYVPLWAHPTHANKKEYSSFKESKANERNPKITLDIKPFWMIKGSHKPLNHSPDYVPGNKVQPLNENFRRMENYLRAFNERYANEGFLIFLTMEHQYR